MQTKKDINSRKFRDKMQLNALSFTYIIIDAVYTLFPIFYEIMLSLFFLAACDFEACVTCTIRRLNFQPGLLRAIFI